jgi:GTP-binding protein LepA
VTGYWPSPLVKLDILVNGEPVDALSTIVHRMRRTSGPRPGVEDARVIPRQMFEVGFRPPSAAVIARIGQGASQDVWPSATAATSGKRKLLEKRRREEADETRRARRDSAGAFLAVLKIGTEG